MASGVKQNETRSWRTSYRGDLIICSAKRKPSPEELGVLEIYEPTVALPYGCALCIVELYDCVPTSLFHGATPLKLSQAESNLGDYTPGTIPTLRLIVKISVPDYRRVRRAAHRTGQQWLDLPM